MIAAAPTTANGYAYPLPLGDVEGDLPPVENTILQTTHYGLFRLDPTNRPIDQKHVGNLVESISKKNLLHLFPIIVSPNHTVIDGQHRLKAAETLKIPIFYIVSQQMYMEDAAEVAANTEGWTNQDWLHHWVSRGNLDYIILRDFWAEHRWMPLASAQRLISSGKTTIKVFADGVYQADRVTFGRKVAEICKDFQPWFKWWNSVTFIAAVMQLAANEQYNHRQMLQKMQYLSTKLVRCPTVEMYLDVITEIYNYKTNPDRRVIFRAKSRLTI